MISGDFSGVGVVARDGSVVLRTHAGFADVDAGRPWTRETPGQISSISKQFAASVALILVDRGALALADPISNLLPDCPAQWHAVTVQHLLTHTSGMTHWGDAPGFVPSLPMEPGERLALLLQAPLRTRPGSDWCYSSPGYIVLSAVLEAVTQRPYAELVNDEIIEALGLSDTTVGQSTVRNGAFGYRDGVSVTPWDLHTMPGTGDIWSTADDLARFVNARYDGDLIPRSTRAALLDVRVEQGMWESSGPVLVSGYGLGQFFGTIRGQAAYFHPGDNPGYQSFAGWIPATRSAVVVLGNDEGDDIDQCVADLLGRLEV